jgi:hypothetical protein
MEAPEIRRAAEPRRWSARMAIGIGQKSRSGNQREHVNSEVRKG